MSLKLVTLTLTFKFVMKVQMFVQFSENVITFQPFWVYSSNLNSVLIIYIIHALDACIWNWCIQNQIDLQTATVFEKKLNCFSLNLQSWTVNWSCTGFKHGDGLGAGGKTPIFCECKKALTSLLFYILLLFFIIFCCLSQLKALSQRGLSSDFDISTTLVPVLKWQMPLLIFHPVVGCFKVCGGVNVDRPAAQQTRWALSRVGGHALSLEFFYRLWYYNDNGTIVHYFNQFKYRT